MALRFLRLRRSLLTLSTLHRAFTCHPIPPVQQPSFVFSQSRAFTASRVSLGSERKYKLYQEGDEITEDTILFPGCDYNHWLITVDFPKDTKPSPEEMVATYERICAQGLNISIEEAKKKIYACSTTTYEGFQAVMTEEESEKFKDVPGVVFVLPDSYIDPVNQQYGGDKYENGVITPRPPPVQHQNRRNRQPRYDYRGNQNQGGQYNQQSYSQGGQMPNQQGNPQYGQQGFAQGGQMPNRQRNIQYDQQGFPQGGQMQNQQGNPQYDQQGFTQGGQMPNRQGDPQYDQQGPMQGGGRSFGPTQDYRPQHNYGPPGQGERMPMNDRDYAPRGRDGYQDTNRGSLAPHQGSYNQGQQGNFYSRDERSMPQGGWGNYGTPGQGDVRGDNQNDHSPNAINYGRDPSTGYEQGGQGNYAPMRQRGPNQGTY